MDIGTDYKLVPLKCWFILREDISYSYNRIFNLGIESILKPFGSNIRKEWIQDGSKFETYMMFSLDFINRLEEILIKNGIHFKWIYSNGTTIGILIEPTRIYFKDTIFKDCLTLKEYSKHRLTQMEEN